MYPFTRPVFNTKMEVYKLKMFSVLNYPLILQKELARKKSVELKIYKVIFSCHTLLKRFRNVSQ